MADQASGIGSGSSIPAKVRVVRSAVHAFFDQVELEHPKDKRKVDGSLCTLCRATFLSTSATNLKNHLSHKHPEAFEQVLRKYIISLFCIECLNLLF